MSDPQLKRYCQVAGGAMMICVIGFFTDGEVGFFVRLVGVIGVVMTGAMFILTGDVLIGRKDQRRREN